MADQLEIADQLDMPAQLDMDNEITEEILLGAGYNNFREGGPDVGRLVEVFCFPLDEDFPHVTFEICRGLVHDTNINAILLHAPCALISIVNRQLNFYDIAYPYDGDTVAIDEDEYSSIYWRYHIPRRMPLLKKKKRETDPIQLEQETNNSKKTKKIIPLINPAGAAARALEYGGRKTKKTRKSRKSRRKK